MMSSSSAIVSTPPHPEAADDEAAAIDEGHPQIELADQEIADQRQRDNAKADRHEYPTDPQSDDGVDQHEIDRPKGSQLPRPKMAEPAAEHPERDEQQKCGKHPVVESANAGPQPVRCADGNRSCDPHDIERNPRINPIAR